jgi:Raf kinase inhibitor-like YbhB/YbcL family protein
MRFAPLLLALALAGCGGGEKASRPAPAAPERIELTSSAFADGQPIPTRFTCDGGNVSPPLAWKGVPAGARELALLVEDPDAPGGTYVHWLLYGVKPETSSLSPGQVPAGARQGKTSAGETKYGGPCPPKGDAPHHYEFTLYALSKPSGLPAGASPDEVTTAVGKAALARGRLTGRYGR